MFIRQGITRPRRTLSPQEGGRDTDCVGLSSVGSKVRQGLFYRLSLCYRLSFKDLSATDKNVSRLHAPSHGGEEPVAVIVLNRQRKRQGKYGPELVGPNR